MAENLLNREFHADKPNEKWLTDVTEFKWYAGIEVHKVYLSAILDLYDRRIVSYVISDRNNNPLVFDTLDAAIAAKLEAHPMFHSDRGFQYTIRQSLVQMIDEYITYYNNKRLQRNLGVLTPIEKHNQYYLAA